MKKLYYLISMLAVLSLGACQNEDDFASQEQKLSEVEVEAILENGTNSRTSLKEGKVYWEENDALSVFLGNSTGQKATIIKESMNDTYAQFKITTGSDVILGGGTEDDENSFANVAYYPYGNDVTITKEGGNYIVSAVLPSEQNYKNGSFDTNVYPMVAVNDGLNFGFRNVAGMIHIPLKGNATITKVTVESNSHKLAGSYKVTASANAVPTMEMASNATNLITLNCGNGVTLNESTALGFDFVLPVGTYEGNDLTFKFYDNNNGYMEFVAVNDDKVERSKRTVFSEKTYEVTGYNLSDDVVAWIGNNTYTSISSAVENSQPNDVVKVKPGTYTEVVNVKGGKNVVIQPANVGDEVAIAGIDHQSNANPSTIVVKNITLDNTLQIDGWFTGTAPNIKPCVGAWGGYFTFEDCKFIVSGESKAETGVMTWWTGENDMTLKFEKCTFEGNNASARAMQIYGHVDLAIEDCTFNTNYRYSLKYVGEEGHTATFENNKVYNATNFVELGTTTTKYQGQNCIVKFISSTLGEGVGNYNVANDEGQTIYVDGSLVVSTDEQFLSALTDATASDIKILLDADVNLPQDKDVSASNVSIDGNNHVIQITSHYRNLFADFTASDAKLVLKNLTVKGAKTKTTDGSPINKTWDLYSIMFNCDVEMTNVNFDQCVCIADGANAVLNNVNITENTNPGLYAMWIEAKGSTVIINKSKIDNINGRGIKIDEQYVESTGGTVKKTILNVTNTEFITSAKAAIMVKSKAGADITLANINIENVAADNENAVWCDEDAASYNNLITVTGGQKKIEGQ